MYIVQCAVQYIYHSTVCLFKCSMPEVELGRLFLELGKLVLVLRHLLQRWLNAEQRNWIGLFYIYEYFSNYIHRFIIYI